MRFGHGRPQVVWLPVGPVSQRLLVRSDAVVELLGRNYVYVVRQDKARRLQVKLGVTTLDRVESLPVGAQPVKVGDLLIVEGVPRLIPDAPVQVVPNGEPKAAMVRK